MPDQRPVPLRCRRRRRSLRRGLWLWVSAGSRSVSVSRSDLRGQSCALFDGTLGVEFASEIRAADDVGHHTRDGQFVHEIANRLLPGADDDVVDLEKSGLLVLLTEGDMQAGVVDALVVDARELVNALVLEGRPVDPAGGLREAGADASWLALEEVDLPLGELWYRSGEERPGPFRVR